MFEISVKSSAYLQSPALLKSAYIWEILQCAPGIKWAPTNQPPLHFLSPIFSAAATHTAPLPSPITLCHLRFSFGASLEVVHPYHQRRLPLSQQWFSLVVLMRGREWEKSTPDYRKWHFKCEDNPPPRRRTGSHLHVWADHRRTQLPAAFVSSIGKLHHCKPPLAPTLCLPQNNCSVLLSSSGGARVSSCIKASGGPSQVHFVPPLENAVILLDSLFVFHLSSVLFCTIMSLNTYSYSLDSQWNATLQESRKSWCAIFSSVRDVWDDDCSHF